MTAHELTPGDLDDAGAIAYKLRTRGFAAVPSHDTARTIERLVTAYSSLATRYDALREALGRDLDADGPAEQGGVVGAPQGRQVGATPTCSDAGSRPLGGAA